jgi:hypothetical protein
LNGRVLLGAVADAEWKDPQIFSPLPQPNSGGKGVYAVNAKQRLLRLPFAVPAGFLKRGENLVGVRVVDRPAYRIGEDVQVEKVELGVGDPGVHGAAGAS